MAPTNAGAARTRPAARATSCGLAAPGAVHLELSPSANAGTHHRPAGQTRPTSWFRSSVSTWSDPRPSRPRPAPFVVRPGVAASVSVFRGATGGVARLGLCVSPRMASPGVSGGSGGGRSRGGSCLALAPVGPALLGSCASAAVRPGAMASAGAFRRVALRVVRRGFPNGAISTVVNRRPGRAPSLEGLRWTSVRLGPVVTGPSGGAAACLGAVVIAIALRRVGLRPVGPRPAHPATSNAANRLSGRAHLRDRPRQAHPTAARPHAWGAA